MGLHKKLINSIFGQKTREGPAFGVLLHMLEVAGQMVVAMPRAHPGVRVQVEVDKDMYERTGLPLGMGVINDEKGQDTADTQG